MPWTAVHHPKWFDGLRDDTEFFHTIDRIEELIVSIDCWRNHYRASHSILAILFNPSEIVTVEPSGSSTLALYTAASSPTFVTVLLNFLVSIVPFSRTASKAINDG